MGSFSSTPTLQATGTILPYTFVGIGSADNTGAAATANTTAVLGVSDGSTLQFDSANHATTGLPITLQGGDVVLIAIAASTAITRGNRLEATTSGYATAANTGVGPVQRWQGLIALESVSSQASNVIIRAYKNGGYIHYPTTL